MLSTVKVRVAEPPPRPKLPGTSTCRVCSPSASGDGSATVPSVTVTDLPSSVAVTGLEPVAATRTVRPLAAAASSTAFWPRPSRRTSVEESATVVGTATATASERRDGDQVAGAQERGGARKDLMNLEGRGRTRSR